MELIVYRQQQWIYKEERGHIQYRIQSLYKTVDNKNKKLKRKHVENDVKILWKLIPCKMVCETILDGRIYFSMNF